MEPELSADDLAERWTLDAGNWELLANKTFATIADRPIQPAARIRKETVNVSLKAFAPNPS